MNAPFLDRLHRITGNAPAPMATDVPVSDPVPSMPRAKPDFTALERLPGYWRGRAGGRQAAVDFHRGEACQRAETAAVDTSHDLLRDHAMIAEYERRAEEVRS